MNPKFASFAFFPLLSPPPFPPPLLLLLLPTPWLYVEVPMATLNPSKVTLMEGKRVDLSCMTSGVPSPELIWNMALVSNYEVRSHTHMQTHTYTQNTENAS